MTVRKEVFRQLIDPALVKSYSWVFYDDGTYARLDPDGRLPYEEAFEGKWMVVEGKVVQVTTDTTPWRRAIQKVQDGYRDHVERQVAEVIVS